MSTVSVINTYYISAVTAVGFMVWPCKSPSAFKNPWVRLYATDLLQIYITYTQQRPGSVVGTAIGYRLDGPGIEPWWGARFSAPVQTGPRGPPSLLYNGYCVFLGVKSGWVMMLTPHPLLMPWSWKGRAIPLLPLWAVRPVQSLSACTRVHFTFYIIIFINNKRAIELEVCTSQFCLNSSFSKGTDTLSLVTGHWNKSTHVKWMKQFTCTLVSNLIVTFWTRTFVAALCIDTFMLAHMTSCCTLIQITTTDSIRV